MIWHVVQARAGIRCHSLVYEFIDGHRVGRHGPVCYCRRLKADELPLLALLRAELELSLAFGEFPPNNELRGFKWVTDIRSTFPSSSVAAAAKPNSPPRGEPIKCSSVWYPTF